MWSFVRICAHARSWREFAKCRFAHFPSFFSVHVDTYDFNSIYYLFWAEVSMYHVHQITYRLFLKFKILKNEVKIPAALDCQSNVKQL